MSDHQRTLAWLGEAIKLEERGRAGYQKAQAEMGDPLARELFGRLGDLENDHIVRIKELFEQISQNQAWPKDKGPAPAAPQTLAELRAWFKEPLTKNKGLYQGADALKAAEIGADFEAAAVDFYKAHLAGATSEGERKFLTALMKEEETHLAWLNELKLYYRDPESWALEVARGGLDGA